jgi:hypothetical protein
MRRETSDSTLPWACAEFGWKLSPELVAVECVKSCKLIIGFGKAIPLVDLSEAQAVGSVR